VKIEILDEAQDDLIEGFHFYEDREIGLGTYFLDCLFSDIDSLLLYAGIHQVVYGYHMPYWTVAGIHRASGNG